MGQGHALGVAVEQVDPNLLLQLLDGQGQGGLGDIHRLCGGRDRAGFGDGDEVTDLTQGHHGESTRWTAFIDFSQCISFLSMP
ncbi:hypothetical protein D3C78_1878930 [compost metagenome]